MYLITITRINFKSRPDDQTVTYAKRVPEWMAQWTVRNNYEPLVAQDLEVGMGAVINAVVDKFWETMNSAVSELIKRPKAEHMADFSFDYTIHKIQVGGFSRYHGCGSFDGDCLAVLDRDMSHDARPRTKLFRETRARIIELVRLRFADGNLMEQFQHHKYSLKALCDEQGIHDVTRLMDDFAVEFVVGSMDILDMDLDQMVEYIMAHSTEAA